MISLRRRHPWLTRARISTSEVANEHLLVHAEGPAGDRLTLALNLADQPYPLPSFTDVVESNAPLREQALGPHGWAVLRTRRDP